MKLSDTHFIFYYIELVFIGLGPEMLLAFVIVFLISEIYLGTFFNLTDSQYIRILQGHNYIMN